eukprot:789439_1
MKCTLTSTNIILGIFTIIAMSCVADIEPGDWLPFKNIIGYSESIKLDLSGGTDTNQQTYTKQNVATVVTSVVRWNNVGYHYLSNAFDGSLYHRTHGTGGGYLGWLGTCPVGQTSTITIRFNTVQDISHIVVSQNSGYRATHYAIDGYQNDVANNDDVTEAVHITPMVNTDNDVLGQVHVHEVKAELRELVFYLMKQDTYCSMNEIEIFVRDPANVV